MKKRMLTVALVLAFVMAFLPLSASAAENKVSKYDGTQSSSLRTDGDNVYIDSAADMAFFAQSVTNGTNYKGKNVFLTTDIVWNEGNASDWATTAPKYEWITIGFWQKFFAGNFDGQGHTLSGLYVDGKQNFKGVFGGVFGDVTIKNLSVVNSYFKNNATSGNTAIGFVCVTFRANLVLENINADLIIDGTDTATNLGVLLARMHSDQQFSTVKIKNCVASGKINTVKGHGVGGMIGYVQSTDNAAGKHEITIEDSISNVDVSATTSVAGIIGAGPIFGSVKIKNTVSTGKVTATKADGVGAAVTCCTVGGSGTFETSNVYVLNGSAAKMFGTDLAGASAKEITEAQLKGDAAKSALSGFDFNSAWYAVEGGYPMPVSVANMLGVVKTPATPGTPENPNKPSGSNPGTSDLSVALVSSVAVVSLLAAAAVIVKRKHA